ncbi:hypothetical protein A2662_01895 [Candidatus Giovannonibacteria bacterium RIFCSPHIGHO2_01_FULL_45_33]|uniref:Uncharacterized protein n=1 Tax=Candidatus Giovannonibacteria bacterium RIFCSPLOWO2_01_FULL_45_34 TaxID=1798351 RepID=A0A1F5WZL4_9BACT|nr:MAG: hypothetical protein A2662_01895 [Candidatus Giovannonibacteria bacterium RIFCSPHIGHO2_01_FULL_45_33]OGF69041.1 MAG: hypothetical protein A3C73_00755 [Candidatus Giovannonibacteria bacterium RIFCSPHIGHO2_02_FULL_44_11]OGF81043.1 MAG: hypothetical protein A2930_03235 [Candidatus Giovannonibacteria bacterium RIFCSPLOWO2_01_FULL_45_34]
MKKTIALSVLCFALLGNAFDAMAGLRGLYLFMELQTVRFGTTKRFYDIFSFDEVLRQSVPPGARRICEKTVAGFNYIFWIETGDVSRNENVFMATIKQSKKGKQIGGFSGDISVANVPVNHGETHLFTVFESSPVFYANIWGTRDLNSISENHQLDTYDAKLECRYTFQ